MMRSRAIETRETLEPEEKEAVLIYLAVRWCVVAVVEYFGNTPHRAHTRVKRAGNTHINAIHNGIVVVRWGGEI